MLSQDIDTDAVTDHDRAPVVTAGESQLPNDFLYGLVIRVKTVGYCFSRDAMLI